MSAKRLDTFRYAERCLYEYKRNMAGLEILRDDLRTIQAGTDVHAQNYQNALDFTGNPSDPVQTRMMRIEKLEERIRLLERFTQPVTRLVEDLTAPYVHEGSAKAEMYRSKTDTQTGHIAVSRSLVHEQGEHNGLKPEGYSVRCKRFVVA